MHLFRKISGILLVILATLFTIPGLFLTVRLVGIALQIHDTYTFWYFIGFLLGCLIVFAIIFALYYYGIKLLKKKPVKRSEAEIINQDLTS